MSSLQRRPRPPARRGARGRENFSLWTATESRLSFVEALRKDSRKEKAATQNPMKNHKIWIVVPASLLLASGFAFAHGHGKGNLFERADRNGDGKVTQAEAAELEATRFTKTDANSDGFLTKEEMRGAFKAHHGDPKAHGEERFAKKDKNSDGKLTADEVPRMPQEFFTKVDADKDGALTKAEFEQFFQAKKAERAAKGEDGSKRGSMARGDTDGDGKISRAESKAMGEAFFQKLDQDQNGVITKEEAKAAREAFGHKRGHHERKPGATKS